MRMLIIVCRIKYYVSPLLLICSVRIDRHKDVG